jgi:hypothetical protein
MKRLITVCAAMTALLAAAGGLQAAPKTWVATGTNDWWTDANWSDNAVPVAGDDVVIANAGAGVVLSNAAPASGWLNSVTISNGASLIFTNWTTTLSATNVTVATNGIMTCAGPFTNAPAMSNRVYVVCSNLTINLGGRIDVSGRGYRGGFPAALGSRNGSGPGGGAGGDPAQGAGHGGYGGRQGGNGFLFGGSVYGSASAPLAPGSGGGDAYDAQGGTHGGGAVRIAASGCVTVNGSILANGLWDRYDGQNGRKGTGSGGSVYITCRTLAGTTGLISADGGAATNTNPQGSGGGGRIAVSNDVAAQALEPAPFVRFSANCGNRDVGETSRGGIGSIYLTDARLLADGLTNVLYGRIESPLAFTNSFLAISNNRWIGFAGGVQAVVTGDVQVSGAFSKLELGGANVASFAGIPYRFDQPGGSGLKVGGSLVLTNSAQLRVFSGATTNPALVAGASVEVGGQWYQGTGIATYVHSHPTNGASPSFAVGSFVLTSNAVLNAGALAAPSDAPILGFGFAGAWGSGGASNTATHYWGWGNGNGYYGGGAGYGGSGYAYSGLGGVTYGDSNAPALPGSGGGSRNYTYAGGGAGGGLIRLTASGQVTLKAGSTVKADGTMGRNATGTDRVGGGGAGGGIYITCNTFACESNVTISAAGGKAAQGNGGGGGGGRVAIWRVADTSPGLPPVNVAGGMGRSNAVDEVAYNGATGTVVWGWIASEAPIVYNSTPSNITPSSATLRGYLHAAGAPAAAVSVYWGDTDGGAPTTGLWQATNSWPAGTFATGDSPSTNVTLPAADRFYYYRFHAQNAAGSSWSATSQEFLGGSISITAAGPAAEYLLVPGTFTVHRASTATGAASVVNFTVSGTASNGVDYTLSAPGGSVTIPAGAETADIVVTPLGDLDPGEGSETVALALAPGLYSIGTPASNTVSITDMAVTPGLNVSVGAGDWNDASRWSLSRRPAAGDDVVLTNGMTIRASSEWLKSLVVSNATLTASNWTTAVSASDVTLLSNGVLACAGPFTNNAMTNRVWLICTNLTVARFAAVDVTGRGFAGGAATANGNGPGGGGGGNNDGGGAGHGERGGSGLYTPTPGYPYDSITAPSLPGSGGGGIGSGNGSAGGGAVRIEAAGRVTLEGSVLADGASGTTRIGYGSGGSVYITCRTLVGTGGVISAKGGAATGAGVGNAGSGAGGRIAVENDASAQDGEPLPSLALSVASGSHPGQAYRGGLGSIYLVDDVFLAADLGNLEGRLHGPATVAATGFTLTNRWLGIAEGVQVTVTGSVTVRGDAARLELGGGSFQWVASLFYRCSGTSAPAVRVAGDLILTNAGALYVFGAPTNGTAGQAGARVDVTGLLALGTGTAVYAYSHPTNGGSAEFRAGTLRVETNAAFRADARGMACGYRGTSSGWGPGKGDGGAGAGYGGAGYVYSGSGGLTYGSSNAPADPGSGGGSGDAGWGGGGVGGGLIRLTVIDNAYLKAGALLNANGADGANDSTNPDRVGGGGSGGGIYLTCRRLYDEAGVSLLARGGKAALGNGGGGGGGRIAVWREVDLTAAQAATDVAGGGGRSASADQPLYDGLPGTVVWGNLPPRGTLFILR